MRSSPYLRCRLLELIALHCGDAAAVARAIEVSRATLYGHMQCLGLRTGKRKFWNLLNDHEDSAATRLVSTFSHVSRTAENLARELRKSEAGNSESAAIAMS
jgi:hypothetical protein